MSDALTVNPLSEVMGAEILNVDLASGPQPYTLELIKDAFLKHRLLIIRDQKVAKQHLRDFASSFGPIETHAVALKGVEGEALTGVHYITNLDSNGVPVEKPIVNSNYFWHSDKSFLPVPSLATMLSAVEIPPSGGDTQFADMTRAYEALSDDDKALLEGRTVVQSLAHMREVTGNALPTAEEMENAPPVEHPLVRTHPETGEKSLYLGMYAAEIQGLPEDDGKALLARLSAHATEERFIFTQKWQSHDLVLWDNRCLMHRAVANYEMGRHRRILMRVVVRGTKPV